MSRKRRRRNMAGELPAPEYPATFAGDSLKELLRHKAQELGLWMLGVTTSEPAETLEHYESWIASGYHGEMGYLARPDRLERRHDLSVILEGVKCVIPVLLPYWPGFFPEEQKKPERGCISCYAWGEDYHSILESKLKELGKWLVEQANGAVVWYVDTGAIQERELAARAGLGFVGKNTMLIHPKYGSGFFLGELLCTHPLSPDPQPQMPSCGTCRECMVACPTQAFTGPYQLDARRCISYLTIELKGSIPEEMRPLMGNMIYGCDICQQVCPWTKFAGDGPSPLWGSPPEEVTAPKLMELMTLDEEAFQARFAGTPIRRITRVRLLRNVAVALGNSKDPKAIPALLQVRDDADPLVQEHISWALHQLEKTSNPQ